MDGAAHLLGATCWQTAILAAVVLVVTRLARKAPAAWRHALWVIVLVKLLVPPLAQIPAQWVFWQAETPPTSITVAAPLASNSTAVILPSNPTPDSAIKNAQAPVPSHTEAPFDWRIPLVAVWLAGVAVMSLLLIYGYGQLNRLARCSHQASGVWADMLERAADPLGVGKLPDIRFTDSVPTPVLVGYFRPVILIPSGIEQTCSDSDLFAILSHELAHIRRRDVAVAWFQQIIQTLFFFHPGVWLAGYEIRKEREFACDEMVISNSPISREAYASGYVSALKLASRAAWEASAIAMAEPRDLEKKRLSMILHNSVPRMSTRWIVVLLALLVLGLPTISGVAKPVLLAEAVTPIAQVVQDTNSDKKVTHGSLNNHSHARRLVQPSAPTPPNRDEMGNDWVLRDDFSGPNIDQRFWTPSASKDCSVTQSDGQMVLTIGPNASGDKFEAECQSTWGIKGDFDMRVDYELLDWPEGNGVRIGMSSLGKSIQRTSVGSSEPTPDAPYDMVAADFGENGRDLYRNSSKRGSMRLVRSGKYLLGYHRETGDWKLVYGAAVGDFDLPWVIISAWTHDYAFSHQQVRIAFTNFTVRRGNITGPVPIHNPQNGHYYMYVNTSPNGILWDNARKAAEAARFNGLKGHLATITSNEENDFITSILDKTITYWIGAFQRPNSKEPNTGWRWITREKWNYTNWFAEEPNNTLNNEDRLELRPAGEWNDSNKNTLMLGYVVEFEGQD